MMTLTEIAYYTRKAVVWVGLGMGAFLVLRVVFFILLAVFFPPAPPAPILPTVGYGPLPPIQFATQDRGNGLSYKLEIKEGELPDLGQLFTVYFIKKDSPNLLAKQNAVQLAQQLEFVSEPFEETASVYRFVDPLLPRTLTVNPASKTVDLSYDVVVDTSIFANGSIDPVKAVQTTIEKKKKMEVLPDTIDSESYTYSYLNFENNTLIETQNSPDIKAIRLDLFKRPINEIPVVMPEFNKSMIYAIYTGNRSIAKRYIELHVHSFSPDVEASETYPIITSQQAYEELQAGRGYVVARGNPSNPVIIRRVYLAYAEPYVYEPYLQPVFVFEGDGNFAAYVPAITAEWISQ